MNECPVKKNEDYVISIDNMGSSGEGVGRVDGFTVFVPGAIKGEKVKIKVVKVNKNFAFGKLIKIVEQSGERVDCQCSVFKRCGGCQLQYLSYKGQLEYKKQKVKDDIERISRLNVPVYDTISMDNPYEYRNKVQLPVRRKDGKSILGFFAERSHDIIEMNDCIIENKKSKLAADVVKTWIEKYNIEPYDEKSSTGVLRHLMIRTAFKTGEVMVVLVTNGVNLPYKNEIIQELSKKIDGIKSIIQNINDRKGNTVLGKKNITLWGRSYIEDSIGSLKFDISPLSFFQVNPVQTEVLYKKVIEYCSFSGDEVVFDAYCGIGTISLFVSRYVKMVYGVEIVPEAIINAKENAKKNNIDNVKFITGKSEEVIPDLISKGVKADIVIVDPPRKGCAKELIEEVSKMRPKEVIYVSCNPATLARDLKIFDGLGYKTCFAQPVDMFPQTYHVETIVKITK